MGHPCTKDIFLFQHILVKELVPALFSIFQELDTKCTRMEEDTIVTKAMKSQLTLFPDIEKEVKKLREQNAQLR